MTVVIVSCLLFGLYYTFGNTRRISFDQMPYRLLEETQNAVNAISQDEQRIRGRVKSGIFGQTAKFGQ